MIQKPKGTLDTYGRKGYLFTFLTNYLHNFMQLYNYKYIGLPTFESSDLFMRGVGDSTDIVNKEMYTFNDKGGRSITLRPEMTASVARCLVENKIYADVSSVNKFYYIGPCFRYERPQNGRYREFNQFGIEAFGAKNPALDAEVISVGVRFLSNIGLDNLTVKLNTLGDKESRKQYHDALVKYFEKGIDSLCDDCKDRYKKNPLRILDCKVDADNDLIKNAPKTINYLNEESKKYFEDLKKCLDEMNIKYELDSNLVRGLDYYTHTVFEVVSDLKNLGPASTILGGGRYDDLVETIGGPSTPGVGFALGIERMIKILESEEIEIREPNMDVYIVNMCKGNEAYKLCDTLRSNGYACEVDYLGKSMKGMFKMIDKYNPTYVLIVGENEVKGNFVTVKDNATKESNEVDIKEIVEYLDMNL